MKKTLPFRLCSTASVPSYDLNPAQVFKFLRCLTGVVLKATGTSGARERALFALLLSLIFPSAFAQGWVNFMNSPATLFSVRNSNGAQVGINGTYFFSILTAPLGTIDPGQFTFGGLYATNLQVAGRFSGGTFVSAPNWAVGTSKSFVIAGWSANLGFVWDPAWLTGVFSHPGYFGVSAIATGEAGGIISTNLPPLPPLNPFGGGTGLQSGFSLYAVDVPELSTAQISALGTGSIFLWRCRRKVVLDRTRRWLSKAFYST